MARDIGTASPYGVAFVSGVSTLDHRQLRIWMLTFI